jgi:microcystin-dependent protein
MSRQHHHCRASIVGSTFLLALVLLVPTAGHAQDPFIGEIRMFAGTFAPKGWALCDGQLLSIANNQALFSLLGTTYGGNGQTTFALPDLRGRVPMHPGNGPGLTPRILGEAGGAENHTLILPEIPTHSHQALADTGVGTTGDPGNALPARNAAGIPQYSTHANVALSPLSIAPAGGNQPHSIMQPYTTVNFIIALVGIFPSRP